MGVRQAHRISVRVNATTSTPQVKQASIPAARTTASSENDWQDVYLKHRNSLGGDSTEEAISNLTAFDSGDEFENEQRVRDYFTVDSMRSMGSDFGVMTWQELDDGGADVEREYALTQNDLNEMADYVIDNRWHMSAEESEAAPEPFTEKELTRARDYRKSEAHEFRGLKHKPTVEHIAGDMRERPEEYAFIEEIEALNALRDNPNEAPAPTPAYLDPHYFDTDSEDYVRNGEMPDEEFVHRFYNRRPEFGAFVNSQSDALDFEIDRYDWALDEASHPIIIDSSKVDLLTERAKEAGFTTEVGDEDFDSDGGGRTKMWVYDPEVMELMPRGYNPYSLRNPEASKTSDGVVESKAQPVLSPEALKEIEKQEDYFNAVERRNELGGQ